MHRKSSSQNMTAATRKRGSRTKKTKAFLMALIEFIISSENHPGGPALRHDLLGRSWVTDDSLSFYTIGRFE